MSPSAYPHFFEAIALVVGACIGSFLNVVISRVPEGRSIVRPGSHCACGQPIAWRDNIPLLSWLALRGRARCCGRRISVRYPLVEVLTALLFLACWRLFPPAVAVCGAILLSDLIAATVIDLDHLIIPDSLTIGVAIAGLVLCLLVPSLHGEHSGIFLLDSLRSGTDGLVGLLIGSGLVLWISVLAEAMLKKEAMGFGDVKFIGTIGVFCGWRGAVFAVFGGAVIGSAVLLGVLAGSQLRRAKPAAPEAAPMGLGTQVPFGPMLAVGGALYFLALRGPVDAWFARIGGLY